MDRIQSVRFRAPRLSVPIVRFSPGGGDGDTPDGGRRHLSVRRTETYQDPEGLEEREI